MKEALEGFIKARVKNHKEAEVQEIIDIFEERRYVKGSQFKQANTIGKELGFLVSGSVRLLAIKSNGDEITGRIVQHNNFIVDIISLRTQESNPIMIEFLESSSMLVTPIPKMKRLLESNLAFNILVREHMADRTAEFAKQYMTFLTGTAKERYQFIVDHNPSLFRKFPLRFIATMIGVTPTQLSRIRNKK